MIFVACSGFPVPVSRYWKEFDAVEITETELGMPGEGTVRRWMRESPEDFAFALKAPHVIADAGFKLNKESKKLVESLGKLAFTMSAHAVVFMAPDTFKPTKTTRAAVKDFLKSLPKKFPPVVLDMPKWTPQQVLSLGQEREIIVAYDPLNDTPPACGELAYVRLPGPAGHRSRYDDLAVEKVAEHCRSLEAETTLCVFRNIDMHANATTLRKKLRV